MGGYWNEGDVERVLAHFSDDTVFTSPTAADVVGTATVRGKDALRAYWATALKRIGSVHFSVDHVLWDETRHELAIIYTATMAGKSRRVSENLRLGDDDKIVAAEVFHGAVGPV
ncbi:MAG: nuclear transport factor 2 family protein [Pseudomonadota bacterium]